MLTFILVYNQKNGKVPVHMYIYVLLKYLMDSCLTKAKPHRSCQEKTGDSGSMEIFDQQEKKTERPPVLSHHPRLAEERKPV